MAKEYSVDKRSRWAAITGIGDFFSTIRTLRATGSLPYSIETTSIVNGFVLVGILAVGAFLRLWLINSLGYNSDEAVYAGQGAAIAADPTLKEIFPIFRAHPLLFQFILAIGFSTFGLSDLLGRL